MNVSIQHSLYCRCLFNIESSNLTTLFYRAKQSSSLGIIAPAFGVVAFICGFSFAATQLLPCQDSKEDDIQKKKEGVSKCVATVPQQIPECEEISSDTWRSRRTFGLLHKLKDVVV